MLIRSYFDLQFYLSAPTAFVVLLHLYPSLEDSFRSPDVLLIESHPTLAFGNASVRNEQTRTVPFSDYLDLFGNRCTRFFAPAGHLRLSGNNLVEFGTEPDRVYEGALQCPVEDLPSDVLQFLLPSRYCQIDQFGAIAQDLFSKISPGWARATAIRDWVHDKVTFNYNAARPTKTAMDVFMERVGVCRDFQHLAITLSRCMNLPARYVTGYIGDIRQPYSGVGDFSAWYQVFLDGRWVDLDARHNYPRRGRILMAMGRDAADVAITTSFGTAILTSFLVESSEVDLDGTVIPLPTQPATSLRCDSREGSAPTQTNLHHSPTQIQSATS